MLQMGLPKCNVYNLSIVAIIYFVLIFCINNSIREYYKLRLVYYFDQKFLLLYKLKPYKVELESTTEAPGLTKVAAILKMKAKSFLILFLPL